MKTIDPIRDTTMNPWVPMKEPIDLKHLGKLGEEVCEAGAAAFRCIIQGIDESEPVTGKINREWLEDELADVEANIELVKAHFNLNQKRMGIRKRYKKRLLSKWHNALITKEETTSMESEPKKKNFLFKEYSLKTVLIIGIVLVLLEIFGLTMYSITEVFK